MIVQCLALASLYEFQRLRDHAHEKILASIVQCWTQVDKYLDSMTTDHGEHERMLTARVTIAFMPLNAPDATNIMLAKHLDMLVEECTNIVLLFWTKI